MSHKTNQEIELIPTKSDDELYCKYDTQSNCQPVALVLNCEERTLSASFDGNIGPSRSARSFHGLDIEFSIPPLRMKPLADLMNGVKDFCLAVLNGFSSEWDGSNWVGVLTNDAQEACEALDFFITNETDSYDSNEIWEVWDAGDYLEPVDVVKEYNLKSTTTDKDIEAISESIIKEAESDGCNLDQRDVEYRLQSYRDIVEDELEDSE